MKKKAISVVLCVTLLSSVLGCGSLTWEEHKGAAVGAGAGAATGAVAGALIGGDTKGAIIGGLLGALAGGVIGHYAYDQPRTREQTAQEYRYDESRGRVLTMENVSATPQTIRQGDSVDLKMTYAVLTPSSGSVTKITEIREITRNGELVGNPTVTVDRYDGTYTSNLPLRLPTNAKTGLYLVKYTVQSEYGKDSLESSFTVR
jgi:outer membrane lipoprotein SlyB